MNDKLLYKEKTDLIINRFFKVYNTLGYGFLLNVYKNALAYELKQLFHIKTQHPIDVLYENIVVGKFKIDFIIDNVVLLYIISIDDISKTHKAQLLNFLKTTEIKVGLVLNFGKKPSFERMVY
ncbi:MAG: GxxExxY protein [Defluviitaleaceae bacterium]|nr:GxxExxY protein [Defluviitaleaceae bacterium]